MPKLQIIPTLSLDSKLSHSAAQRRGINTKAYCCAFGFLDYSINIIQDVKNMFPLDIL